jgi:hypothetical protein
MALLGGGGAPNVSGGSNPAGAGKGLNIIQNHAYAYSGVVAAGGAGSADTEMLKFSTGNYYVVCKLYWGNDQATASDTYFEFLVDDTIVYTNKHGRTDDSDKIVYGMLLPPYSKCVFKMGIGGGGNMTTNLVGEVYA